MSDYPRSIFVNCPFDDGYRDFFFAIVFVILRSGFIARCALETDDAGRNRFDLICGIIRDCRLGIHDISRTETDGEPPLPRFNMPLELGLFLGASRYGSGRQREKRCLVLDRERYRYQRFISDIAGHDIHSHDGDRTRLIIETAAWIRDHAEDPAVPGGKAIARDHDAFREVLPQILAARDLTLDEITFKDYCAIVAGFLATDPAGA